MTYQPLGMDAETQAAISRLYDPRPVIPARWLLVALGGSVAVVAGLMVQNGLTLVWRDASFAAAVLVLGALGAGRVLLRDATAAGPRRLRDFCEFALLLVCFSAVGGLGSYAAASDTRGFVDPLLAGLDERLHFNWLTWYELVVAHPLLQHLGAAAYGSIYLSPLLLIGALAWGGKVCRARRFLLTYWLGAAITLALFPLFPAKGALDHLWHGAIPYMPTNGLFQGAIIPALRDHTFGAVSLGGMKGLVCAPSFHTVCATLYIATALPMRRMRWVLVPVNLAMLLATPVEGTHYLSDMVLGFIVAMAALALVRALEERHAPVQNAIPLWA